MMYGSLCTEFYDIDKRYASQSEVDFYKKFLNQDDLILEPMCGSGRLLLPLLKEGYPVHGLDNSAAMLNSCRERAKINGLEPQLFQGKIETLSLPHHYQAMLIPFGSFQLLFPRDEAVKTLISIYRHLNPHGKLILGLFTPEESLYENDKEEWTVKEVKTEQGETIQHKSHNITHKSEKFVFCDSIYIKSKNGKILQEEKEQMHITWYDRHEIEFLLEKCGFSEIQLQKTRFQDVDHQIYIANKPDS